MSKKNREYEFLEQAFESFRNKVLCRRDISQHEARKILNESIAPYLSKEDLSLLTTEISHYNMEEITTHRMGEFIKEMKVKALKNIIGDERIKI